MMAETKQEGALEMSSAEVRTTQAMLYKRMYENSLSISALEECRSILDLDISIVTCVECASSLKLEPRAWQLGENAEVNPSKTDLEAVCDMILAGRCDCDEEIDLEEEEAKVSSCRLVHLAAMKREYLPLLMFLNKEGCDLNATGGLFTDTPLCVAIIFNQPEIAKYLLSVNVELSVGCQNKMVSPLTTAVQFEREDMVDMILETKKIDINACTDNWNMPLLINCVRLHPEFVKPLLKAGADPNVFSTGGTTALMYAVNSRDIDLVKLLIRYGADVNMKNRRGEMALVIVVYREDTHLVQILLEAGADPNYYTPDGHNSLLLLASYDGSLEIMRSLVNHSAKVDTPNDIGYTPLHIAAWNGHLECVKLLLEAGCPHDQPTKDGNTPLALAAHGNHLKVIEELLPLGCNVNNSDKDQDTPLQYAAYNGMTRAVELLIEHGAVPNMANSVKATALWNAVYQKHKEVVKLLLIANVEMELESIGINQHSQTDQVVHVYDTPRSPLWVATEQNSPDIALLLITAGYDIHKEAWLLDGDFPPRAENTRLNNMLSQYAHSPQRLVTICRNYFRRLFKLEIKTKVQGLHIPESLKNYVTLADMKYAAEENGNS